MKLTNYLFLGTLLSFAVFMTSCGSDDDIKGTWQFQSETYSECTESDENGTEAYSSTPCDATSADDCFSAQLTVTETTATVVFTDTFNGVVEMDTNPGTYTKDGNKLNLCFDGDCTEATFSIDGDQMTLVLAADDDGCVSTTVMTRI